MAQLQPGRQAPAASLQDSAAFAEPLQQYQLPRPAAKRTGKVPAAKAGHARQASTATGTASSAGSDMLQPGVNAIQPTSSRLATGTTLPPQGTAAERAPTDLPAKSERRLPPPAASTLHQPVHPVSVVPDASTDHAQAQSRPAGSKSSSASASAGQVSTAPRAAVTAPAASLVPPSVSLLAPVQRPKAGLTAASMPASVPRQSFTKSSLASVSAAAAAAAAAAPDSDAAADAIAAGPQTARQMPRGATARSSRSSVRAAAAGDDGGADSQSERPTMPASKTAKSHNLPPSAVATSTPHVPLFIPFAAPGTSAHPGGDDDVDDEFFTGVEVDLGSVQSRDDYQHAVQSDLMTGRPQEGRPSEHTPSQPSASQQSKSSQPHPSLPVQAKPDAPARRGVGSPAVAPVSTAASKVSSATASAASSAAAALATHSTAAPARYSSSLSNGAASTTSVPIPADHTPPLSGSLPTAVATLLTSKSPEPVLHTSQPPQHASVQQPAMNDEFDDEASGVEMQSAFVPIPFGGSATAALPAGAGTPFGRHLDADQDDFEDSFFDSINTGAASLPICMSGLHASCKAIITRERQHGGRHVKSQ